MTRKVMLNLLTEQGYTAGREGEPCEFPVWRTPEQQAAWEEGWKSGDKERHEESGEETK